METKEIEPRMETMTSKGRKVSVFENSIKIETQPEKTQGLLVNKEEAKGKHIPFKQITRLGFNETTYTVNWFGRLLGLRKDGEQSIYIITPDQVYEIHLDNISTEYYRTFYTNLNRVVFQQE